MIKSGMLNLKVLLSRPDVAELLEKSIVFVDGEIHRFTRIYELRYRLAEVTMHRPGSADDPPRLIHSLRSSRSPQGLKNSVFPSFSLIDG